MFIPALLIRMSARPNRSPTACSTARTCFSSVTSARNTAASAPHSAAVSSSFAWSRPTSASFAPAAPSSTAIARPSPRLAPVMTATRPSNGFVLIELV